MGGGVTDLVCVCMDPRRLSGWYLLLDSGHSPVGHQDELGGKRHIAAQGPVYLQQVPQLGLLREGQVMWNERNGGKERKTDSEPQANKLQSNTGLQCHTLQNCNAERNPWEQETGNSFLMETSILLSNMGLGQLPQTAQGWLKTGVSLNFQMYIWHW